MNKNLLPQGDLIRQLLIKSSITEPSLVQMLKSKGVFIGNSEKNKSIPLFTKTILSPEDFDDLHEVQKTKEETIKHRTASIECSQDFELKRLMTGNLDVNELVSAIHAYQPGYKVLGNPTFYCDSDNLAQLDYVVERENLVADWDTKKTLHKGSLRLKKETDGHISVSIQQEATSKETFQVNQLLISKVKEILKDNGVVDNAQEFTSIKFSDFSNENRIKFLYSFTDDLGASIKFEAVTNLNLFIDDSVDGPKDVQKFLDEIDNLKLKGKSLHNHVFLKSPEYHKKLLFASVDLKFSAKSDGFDGFMNVQLSFPDYVSKRSEQAEFETQITFTSKRIRKRSRKENKLRDAIYPVIERLKISSFDKYKS